MCIHVGPSVLPRTNLWRGAQSNDHRCIQVKTICQYHIDTHLTSPSRSAHPHSLQLRQFPRADHSCSDNPGYIPEPRKYAYYWAVNYLMATWCGSEDVSGGWFDCCVQMAGAWVAKYSIAHRAPGLFRDLVARGFEVLGAVRNVIEGDLSQAIRQSD